MNKSKISRRKLKIFFQMMLFLGFLLFFCSVQTSQEQHEVNIFETPDNDTSNTVKGVYDIPELAVIPSPYAIQSFTFSISEKVIDYDVSPAGINVAALVSEPGGKYLIKFWQIGKSNISDSCLLPAGFKAKAIAWHPKANAVIVMGEKQVTHQILRIQKSNKDWNIKSIFSTPNQLRRLVVCPRPFIIDFDPRSRVDYYSYRIFFGMDNGDKSYRIVSITETGTRFYQVIGPKRTISVFNDSYLQPSDMESDWALPIAFHPAGHQLIWEDRNHNFFVADYDYRSWGKSKPVTALINNIGTITPTPNGLGFIHWQKDKPGIGVYLLSTKKEETQLPEYHFTSTPSSVPDGKGIVGLTMSDSKYTLSYVPVEVPLADIENAWMFVKTEEEINLFQKHFGLFRPDQGYQLYELYETENYYCGGYDRNAPTRPYLVTTDIFWELFGAAYEGLFIVKERDEGIPNFWRFINATNEYLKKSNSNSIWLKVIAAIDDYCAINNQNPEAGRIKNEKDGITEIFNDKYSYSDLKPRGHYTSTPEMRQYFKAFRYFTTILKSNQDALMELNTLPPEIKVYAEKWIACYSGFIAPSRYPLVLDNIKNTVPSYCQNPGKGTAIFPLSWGFDNEILYSTIFHTDSPTNLQVTGPNGHRMLPSGIDLAAVFGNSLADNLLESDYKEYPPLRKVINNLKDNYRKNAEEPDLNNNLYNQWINAIAVQWADTVNTPNGNKDRDIWQTKRLQTGLATWATLRHATILVNERVGAECGEAGFEEIIMRAPIGYVEPDPYTFATLANLFETAIKYVSMSMTNKEDIQEDYNAEKRSLYNGIVARLKEAAQEARSFQIMAEKERKGELLTNAENEKILYVARTAEHLFLIFNSLSNKDYALSNPDPIAKIADVAGDGIYSPYLMAAVGNEMEWDHIVPFYGRHHIVKGSVYSYYQFISSQLLNDQE
jgi:hypothetical protein